uniref:MATH domain-containing protein n=1 Tax=Oryza punctata TaxID=4537 RepID=A0A0E0M8T1_ORYPU
MGACLCTSGQNMVHSQKSGKVGDTTHFVVSQSQTTKREEEIKTSFKWMIDGFSSLLAKGEGWINSRVFEIKGVNWYLQLNPMDRKRDDEREYVSLILELSQTSLKPDIIIEASFKLLIYDQTYGKHNEYEISNQFHTMSTSSGASCMIPLETLISPSSGFLVGNSCAFGVEFSKVAIAKANHRSETLFVFVNKATALCAREVYDWNIEDFFALKSICYSPQFEIGGHKWYLSMYPSGCDNSGKFLSLYLHLEKPDTLSERSGVLVELSLSIKDQVTGKHRKLTGRCQFSDKEKGDGWGWAKFMSLERFRNLLNGFLVKGKCCIEADLAIIGSSTME